MTKTPVPRYIDFIRPAFSISFAKLRQEVGRREAKQLLYAARNEAEKLFDIDWSNLPNNVTVKPGGRRYRCSFAPGYEFTFRRTTVRKSHRVQEEWIWLATIQRAR